MMAGFLPVFLRAAPETIPLWPEGVPGIHADTPPEREENGWLLNIHHPSLTVYPPTAPANGTGVIYIPGGGYARVSMRGEHGREPIRWLNSLGVTVFLLKYRTGDYPYPVPTQDALRAVRVARAQAAKYSIAPGRLGVMGVSAGGHLATCTATLSDDPIGRSDAEIDRTSARPDFTLLLFPVITMREPSVHLGSRHNLLGDHPAAELIERLSTELHVTKDTPPAFIVSSAEDNVVRMENSFLYYQALSHAGVSAELHLFAQGPHGYGLDPGSGTTTQWPRLAEAWLRSHGWLPTVARSSE